VSVVANVAINVDSSGAVSKLRQVQTQAQSTEKAFGALQSAIGALGVGFALTKVIADVKELDTNLRRLGTVGGNVAALDKGLGALSDRLDGVANKAELAAASYQALSAGFTETGANLRVVEAATKAAVGGLADITGVVDVTTKVLNSYNMSGDQATKVTDSISKAVELGQVQWSDYTSQLGRVASIAAIAGVSLDEVNAFVAAATKNGATAEVAFTGLGASLATIIKPTKESTEAAQALGINWTLAGLRGEGFESLMGQLAKAMESNTEKATEMVGGQEAVRGAFAAASKGGKDYAMILEGLGGAAGKTDADFQTMKGSLENTLKALDTSFKNLSEALGIAFAPTVVIAVQDITKAVNGFADFMATVPQPVMDTTGELVKLIAQMILLKKAIDAIIGLRLAFIGAMAGMTRATVASGAAATTSAGAFALYTNNTRALQAQAAAATPVLNGLLGTLGRLAAIGAIAIVVNIAVTGMAALLQASAEIARLRGQRNQPGGAAGDFGGSITPQQRKENEKTLAAIKKERESPEFKGQQAAAALGIGKTAYNSRVAQLQEREIAARARLALPNTPATPTTPTPTTPTPTAGGGGAAGGGTGKGAGKGKDDAARIAEQIRASKLRLTLAQDIFAIEGMLQQAQLEGNEQLVLARNAQKELAQIASQRADIIADKEMPALEKKNVLDKLAIDAATVSGKLGFDLAKIEQDRIKSFDEIIAGVTNQIDVEEQLTEKSRAEVLLKQEIAKLQKDGVLITDEQVNAYKKANAALDETKAKVAAIKQQQEMLDGLYAGIANTIANGVGGAIDALSSGVDNLGETLQSLAADILKAVGKMLIFYALAQAFGALGGNDGVGVFSFLAKAFGGGRASGGPVAPNTNYIVGENGPELLSMGGSGGKVYSNNDSKMQSAMSRYSRGARGEGVIAGSGGSDSGGSAAAAGPMAIDVRYSVERINDVEYVTASQFQAGLRQAAQQGAAQGEQRTLRRLQQSPSTRKRVGV
jgi:TP901 family phage tail tape measure protein